MARIRSIKPEFCLSKSIARLSFEARLFMVLLLTEADDDGRFVDSAKRLAGALYPWDDKVTAAHVTRWLNELVSENIVARYETTNGCFAAFVNWDEHQKISHPTPSKLPVPPWEASPPSSGPPEGVRQASGDSPEALRNNSSQEVGSRNWEVGSSYSVGGPAPESNRTPEPEPPSPQAAPPAKRQPQRHRLPEGWSPSAEATQRCRTSAPTLDLGEQLEAFRDYHQAKGSLMVDWDAAWRTWWRNAQRWQRSPPGQRAPPDRQAGIRAGLAAIEAEQRAERPDYLRALS